MWLGFTLVLPLVWVLWIGAFITFATTWVWIAEAPFLQSSFGVGSPLLSALTAFILHCAPRTACRRATSLSLLAMVLICLVDCFTFSLANFPPFRVWHVHGSFLHLRLVDWYLFVCNLRSWVWRLHFWESSVFTHHLHSFDLLDCCSLSLWRHLLCLDLCYLLGCTLCTWVRRLCLQ